MLNISRDKDFKYLGIQILADRYFLRVDDKIMEAPQCFWMRVAMGLAINEEDKNEAAIKFYNIEDTLTLVNFSIKLVNNLKLITYDRSFLQSYKYNIIYQISNLLMVNACK